MAFFFGQITNWTSETITRCVVLKLHSLNELQSFFSSKFPILSKLKCLLMSMFIEIHFSVKKSSFKQKILRKETTKIDHFMTDIFTFKKKFASISNSFIFGHEIVSHCMLNQTRISAFSGRQLY